MSPLLKAVALGAGVFVLMMLIFWGVARLAGRSFLELPPRPVPTPSPSPTPALPFLR
jgi:hypothetical protein